MWFDRLSILLFFSRLRSLPSPTLFPYTTLFRSSAFLKDDCVGLSQQIAYSSLLAFFPAMAFLVGALGIFHLLDRKSTRLNSSHVAISYAVFCLKKKKQLTR